MIEHRFDQSCERCAGYARFDDNEYTWHDGCKCMMSRLDFDKMADHFGWHKNSKEYDKYMNQFRLRGYIVVAKGSPMCEELRDIPYCEGAKNTFFDQEG